MYIKFLNKLFEGNILNMPKLICMHSVKWFQVLLSNANSFFHTYKIIRVVIN